MRFQGKIAVVTGGTQGIGKAVAGRFLEEGATVVCAARHEGNTAELTSRYGDRAVYEYADVTDFTSVEKMVARTVEKHGTPSTLIANAGISRDAKVLATNPDDWSAVMDVNVKGVFHCTRAMAPLMVDKGYGRIINVSSIMGTHPTVGAAGYCASKAAIEMFTRVSALELGGKGIRVNALAPGFIETGMGSRLMDNERAWESYRTKLAMRRAGEPEELAAAAAFLASDDASYVNGHVLEISGGLRWN